MLRVSADFDWQNLPSGVVALDLWPALHDAHLISINSNRFDRDLEVQVDIAHIRKHFSLDQSLRFVFRFTGVTSARASTMEPWPGPMPEVRGQQRDDQERLITEYQSKAREVSVGWAEMEAAPAKESMDVLEAMIAQGEAGVAFRAGALTGSRGPQGQDRWFNLFIRSSAVAVLRSDGQPCGLDELMRLGEQYWDDFGSSRGP
jgi:hypothetical protein